MRRVDCDPRGPGAGCRPPPDVIRGAHPVARPASASGRNDARNPVMRISHSRANLMLEWFCELYKAARRKVLLTYSTDHRNSPVLKVAEGAFRHNILGTGKNWTFNGNCLPLPTEVAHLGPLASGRPAPTAVSASAQANARRRRRPYKLDFQSAHDRRQPGR